MVVPSTMPRTAAPIIFLATLVTVLTPLLPTAEAQRPLRIGASLFQTGSFASLGQNQLRGYRLCVKHANEKGGVLGRRIELLVDDESKAPKAAAIYEKLITQDKVDAILGAYSKAVGNIGMRSIESAILENAPIKTEENKRAAQQAFEQTRGA